MRGAPGYLLCVECKRGTERKSSKKPPNLECCLKNTDFHVFFATLRAVLTAFRPVSCFFDAGYRSSSSRLSLARIGIENRGVLRVSTLFRELAAETSMLRPRTLGAATAGCSRVPDFSKSQIGLLFVQGGRE